MKYALIFTLLFCLIGIKHVCCEEGLAFVGDEWQKLGSAQSSDVISFKVSLKHHNKDEFQSLCTSITTPGSDQYGQYRSIPELAGMLAPPHRRVHALVDWLTRAGMSARAYGTFVSVTGTVSAINSAFSTRMERFVHSTRINRSVVRSLVPPNIPKDFDDVIGFITGLSDFPPVRTMRRPRVDSSSDTSNTTYVVPQTLQALYGIPDGYHAQSGTRSSQAVVEFGQSAGISQTDLETFMTLTDLPNNVTLSYTVGNFEWDPRDPIDGESTLDVQYMMGIAVNVPTSFWVVDGWIYDLTTLVEERANNGEDIPLVFSISYGWAESEQCFVATDCGDGVDSEQYVDACSIGFQMMGAAGITVVVASGDAGAATKSNQQCKNMAVPIQPDYPASDPYVTSVGGTMLLDDGSVISNGPTFCNQDGVRCAGGGDEIVCSVPQSLITSGGGFSNYSPQQSWQSSAIDHWMNSGALQPPSQFWNPNGRGYPDVAALAHSYMVIDNGYIEAVDGTSASAPVIAAIFSLVNDRRLSAGLPPLGFASPILYNMAASRYSDSFHDVTDGNNAGTEVWGIIFKHYCTTFGYGAAEQWDPTTGWGTPKHWLDSDSYLLQPL